MDHISGKAGQPKKKKRVGKYILLILLFLFIAAIVAMTAHFYPIWRAAKDFEQKLDFARFSFSMDVELEEEALTGEQRKLISVFAELSGLEQNDFMRMHVEGSVWDDRVYAEITSEKEEELRVELYLSDTEDLVNAGPIYNKIRGRLVEEYALLDYILPAPVGDVYMTLEQAEKLSGEDLDSVREFEPAFSEYNLSAAEYFVILAALPLQAKRAGDNSFVLEELRRPVQGQEDMGVWLHFEVEQPAGLVRRFLEKYAGYLPASGLSENIAEFEALKRLDMTLTSEGAREPVMPANVIDSRLPDIVEGVRQLLEKIGSLTPDARQAAVEEYIRLHEE